LVWQTWLLTYTSKIGEILDGASVETSQAGRSRVLASRSEPSLPEALK
jgi:hypothetical protein